MLKHSIRMLFLFAAIALPGLAQSGPPEGGPDGMMPNARGIGGTVAAISGSTLTVKTSEGDVYQVFTSANSRIMKQRQPVSIKDVHVGDALMAGGEVDAKAKTVGAVFVAILTPEEAQQAKKMHDEFGKTWTAGEVTAIKDTDIILKRRDGVAQTVSVDENTSFKKHNESITLADIQPGDRVTAQGALKGGIFVATAVHVGRMGMGPGGPGRGAGDPAAGDTPPANLP